MNSIYRAVVLETALKRYIEEKEKARAILLDGGMKADDLIILEIEVMIHHAQILLAEAKAL